MMVHILLFVDFNVGTPYQIFMPDYTYNMYKRTYSSEKWGEWYEFGGSSSSSVAWDNITGRPSSYPPSNHNHGTAGPNFTCFLTDNTSAGFSALHDNGTTTGFFLKTIRGQSTAPSWFEGNYASGIAFGGADTHAVISCRYEFPRVTFCGGSGTEPNWWMRLAGTSGHSYKLDDFITTSGTSALSGSIVPNKDVAMELGDESHRFTNVHSSNITTGAIYMEHDSNAIYESGNDSANGNGGGLNNLVIRSWWGVSFTSPAGGGQYGGKKQTAVGIDCREGIVKAYNFAGLINGHSVNSDVPANAKFTDTNTWRPQPDWNATSGDAMIKNKPSLGTAAVKATRTLTSVGASGWQNVTSDQKYVPDMAFIAYWNGAYSGSSSNLTYCNKGAFGTAATANKTDFATANHTHSYLPLAGGTMTGALNMNGKRTILYKNNYMEANEQDINIIVGGKDMFTGYINARVTSALQVRDTSNSAWKPVNAL